MRPQFDGYKKGQIGEVGAVPVLLGRVWFGSAAGPVTGAGGSQARVLDLCIHLDESVAEVLVVGL